MYITSSDEIIFASGLRAAREGRYQDAFDMWKPLAETGHQQAQRNVAYLMYLGLGVTRDPTQAANWLARADKTPNDDPVAVFRTIDRLAAAGARPSAVFARAF
jgi:TPR repeat protein